MLRQTLPGGCAAAARVWSGQSVQGDDEGSALELFAEASKIWCLQWTLKATCGDLKNVVEHGAAEQLESLRFSRYVNLENPGFGHPVAIALVPTRPSAASGKTTFASRQSCGILPRPRTGVFARTGVTMKTATTLVGVIVLATLAGCAKKSPTDEAAADKAAQPSAETKAPQPKKSHAEMAADLLALIDTAPQCQQFRDQLEAAGKTPDDQPLSADSMSMIWAEAHKAGCSKIPRRQ